MKLDKTYLSILIVASVAYFMTGMDASIVNIALPMLSTYFHVNTSQVAAIVLANLLAIASFVLVFGNLSDRTGPEIIFKWGLILFAAASFSCGITPNVAVLTILRFIQGIAEAMIISTCRAFLIKKCPEEVRGKVYGIASVAGDVALALGAPIGALLVKYVSWRYIFFVNVPVGIVGAFLAFSLLGGKTETAPVSGKFDYRGAIYSFLGIAFLIYLLNGGEERGWVSPLMVSCLILSIIFIILFVRWERKNAAPLLDLKMFTNLSFSLVLLCDLTVCMTYEGLTFLFPFVFTFGHNYSHEQIGLLMMIIPTLSMVMSPLAGFLSDKIGPKSVSVSSLMFVIIACILFYLMQLTHDLDFIITSFMIFGISVAIFFISNSCRQMKHAPENVEGQAAALISFNSNLGSILGLCIFETIYSMNFAYHIPGRTHHDVTAASHIAGFHDSCVFAALICAIGLIAAAIARDQKRHQEAAGQRCSET